MLYVTNNRKSVRAKDRKIYPDYNRPYQARINHIQNQLQSNIFGKKKSQEYLKGASNI